ncbi:MAG: DVU0772 family protein [Thermodesulfobacteriota bacterium]
MGQLGKYKDLLIDWDMTPEEAVTLYLEWGNNHRRGERPPVRSKNEHSNYFVVSNWESEPKVYLVRRNSDGAEELAELQLPYPLDERFQNDVGGHRGVYPVNNEIRAWLEQQLFE